MPAFAPTVFLAVLALGGAEESAKDALHLREDTVLTDRSGHFRFTGDRITFFDQLSGQRFDVLENLALERVAQTIQDRPDGAHWSVTGVVTEYYGKNFLLIRRASLMTKIEIPFE